VYAGGLQHRLLSRHGLHFGGTRASSSANAGQDFGASFSDLPKRLKRRAPNVIAIDADPTEVGDLLFLGVRVQPSTKMATGSAVSPDEVRQLGNRDEVFSSEIREFGLEDADHLDVELARGYLTRAGW
jgi:hypothetical protein